MGEKAEQSPLRLGVSFFLRWKEEYTFVHKHIYTDLAINEHTDLSVCELKKEKKSKKEIWGSKRIKTKEKMRS